MRAGAAQEDERRGRRGGRTATVTGSAAVDSRFAEQNESADQADALRTFCERNTDLGVVFKKGSKTRKKAWQKRRVQCYKGVISYYKKKLFGGWTQYRGSSSLEGAVVRSATDSDKANSIDVEVKSPEPRTYLFALSTEEEARHWHNVIMKHAAYCQLVKGKRPGGGAGGAGTRAR